MNGLAQRVESGPFVRFSRVARALKNSLSQKDREFFKSTKSNITENSVLD